MATFSVIKLTNGCECEIKKSGLSWEECSTYVSDKLVGKVLSKDCAFVTHTPHYRNSVITYVSHNGEIKFVQYFIRREK